MSDSIHISDSCNNCGFFTRRPGSADTSACLCAWQRVYNTFHVPPALRQTAYQINLRLHAEKAALEAKKQRARKLARNAEKMGKLVRPDTCEQCGSGGRINGHHPDYDQPLLIEWLCGRCHEQADRYRNVRENAEVEELELAA